MAAANEDEMKTAEEEQVEVNQVEDKKEKPETGEREEGAGEIRSAGDATAEVEGSGDGGVEQKTRARAEKDVHGSAAEENAERQPETQVDPPNASSTASPQRDGQLPRYRHDTHVQPKIVLNGDTDRNAEKDYIENAFNQGSFVGIRSLPNAFRPDFRQKLYELVLSRKHRQQSALSRSIGMSDNDLRTSVSYSREILPGQQKQIPFSGAPRAFSSFTYMSSEYDRPSEMSISQSKVERSRWVSDADFKMTALPQVPRSAGSFNEFHYAIEPYEAGEVSATSERNEMLTKRLFGPLRAAGRAAANEQKKILRRECLSRLSDLFAADWGDDVFHSVSEDSGGFVVLKFFAAKQRAADVADRRKRLLRGRDRSVAAYVTNFCQRDAISDEFQLRRDTRRWGVLVRRMGYAKTSTAAATESASGTHGGAGSTPSTDTRSGDWLVFYLIPPWVAYDTNPTKGGVSMTSTLHAKGAGLHATSSDGMRACETPLLSSRLPFGPQTNSGNLILAHTRTLNRSFKFV